MQNKHMVLPPDYKSLWREFQALKQKDVKEGKGWMYDADPFKTLRERQDAKAVSEKKRKEMERMKEKAKAMPGAAGLSLVGTAKAGVSNPMKGWTNIPKIEMGKKSRVQVESLIQRRVNWNPHQVRMSGSQRKLVISELAKLGFRRSHVEEAADICKDREETLEWLLIHVPEDDLPRWALPESYSAGITVGATDLKKETAIKRLSESGYALDLCTRLYEECGCDEGRTAEALQRRLMGSDVGGNPTVAASGLVHSGNTAEELWEEEVGALESFFGGQFSRKSTDIIQVKLESVSNGRQKDVEVHIQVRKSPSYPAQLVITVHAPLPAQVKLSITRQVLAFVAESYSEEPMKVFVAIDWIQQNINSIIENPGKLVDVSTVSSTASGASKTSQTRPRAAKHSKHPRPIRWIPDARSKEEWLRKQESPKWKEMMSKRQQLPAWQAREKIIQTVANNHVTIISGETGSGKSTQSVQFILDDLYSQGVGPCASMLVTQPRRISALGLADRVAEERCSAVGDEVGYAIRGENRMSRQTRITFVTTGILLRRLQTSGGKVEDVVASLADVSHVVIDEVHERSLDTDFLLTILREVMKTRKDLIKLVLMSATLDAASFKDYFASQGLDVGLVEIPGRTYPVEDFYLDDIVSMTGFRAKGDDAYGGVDVGKTIQNLGHRINYDLLTETIATIDLELSYSEKSGGILVFLPGVAEINQTCRALSDNSSLYVLPLHASLETKEQKRVFGRPPPGRRKVVVATNVAETSITIDDIVAVVDSGKVKQTTFDPQNNMRKLEETWASKAACKQRRGRAGRIQAGKCYKLFTRNLEQQMAERPDPEIRRVPLEQMCLSVRAMGLRDVASFLARSPTPPESTAVEGAMKLLRRMGALDGDELTALGQQLAMIPADLRCGKLMVYGAIFGCLDDSVTISAILSTKSPFFSPSDKRELAKEARMRFDKGDGDLLTDLAAYKEWAEMRADGAGSRNLRAFCDDNFLSFLTLSDIAATRTQYYAALAEIGIVSPREAGTDKRRQDNAAYATRAMLRALTASAFSPQIARIQYPEKKFISSVSGAVELDPEARMIKYYTQEQGRVFVHPSSTVFDSQGFSGNAAFMSYFSMISTSKTFIRDLTREF